MSPNPTQFVRAKDSAPKVNPNTGKTPEGTEFAVKVQSLNEDSVKRDLQYESPESIQRRLNAEASAARVATREAEQAAVKAERIATRVLINRRAAAGEPFTDEELRTVMATNLSGDSYKELAQASAFARAVTAEFPDAKYVAFEFESGPGSVMRTAIMLDAGFHEIGKMSNATGNDESAREHDVYDPEFTTDTAGQWELNLRLIGVAPKGQLGIEAGGSAHRFHAVSKLTDEARSFHGDLHPEARNLISVDLASGWVPKPPYVYPAYVAPAPAVLVKKKWWQRG